MLIFPKSTKPEFVTEDSWLVFRRLGLVDKVYDWINLGEELKTESFATFEKFVINLNMTQHWTNSRSCLNLSKWRSTSECTPGCQRGKEESD